MIARRTLAYETGVYADPTAKGCACQEWTIVDVPHDFLIEGLHNPTCDHYRSALQVQADTVWGRRVPQ